MYLDNFHSHFVQLQEYFPEKVKPCTEEQVLSLEKLCGLLLPAAYKEFLLWGGIWAGGFLVGIDFDYDDDMYQLRESLEEVLKQEEFPYPLPEDAFVFNAHQGYIFWFFKTSDGEDPPVYGYKEGSEPEPFNPISFRRISSSVSQFFLEELEAEDRSIQQMLEREKMHVLSSIYSNNYNF